MSGEMVASCEGVDVDYDIKLFFTGVRNKVHSTVVSCEGYEMIIWICMPTLFLLLVNANKKN